MSLFQLLSLMAGQRAGLMAMRKESMSNTLLKLVQTMDVGGHEEGMFDMLLCGPSVSTRFATLS